MAKQNKDFRKVINVKANGFDAEMNEAPVQREAQPSAAAEEPESDDVKPFATRLPTSLITRLQQHQYWYRETIMDTVINALEAHLDRFPDSNKPLPEAVKEKKKRGRKPKK